MTQIYQKGLLAYKGCSSLVTNPRKNNQERKSHWMCFGKSTDPRAELDLNYQLGLFMDMAHTRPATTCAAKQPELCGKGCRNCLPLFPKFIKGPGDSWVLHPEPTPFPACVSAMVVAALRMIGVDTTAFKRCASLRTTLCLPGSILTSNGWPSEFLYRPRASVT